MKKKFDEEVLTKEDIEKAEESEETTIRRVDNRPGSVFSIIIFLMVFLVGYMLYPHVSMLLPIPGEKMTVDTQYGRAGIKEMISADKIVIATVKEKETNAKSRVNDSGKSVIGKEVVFEVKEVIKGEQESTFVIYELGGNVLLDLSGRKKKYNVTYENAVKYDEGATYLLFISEGGILFNGQYGAIKQNSDGSFLDIRKSYTVDEIKEMLNNDGGEQ